MDRIRIAQRDDVPAMNALITTSATELSQGFYSPGQIVALITHVFGVDTQLLRDRTYFAVERDGHIVACGGWSRRQTLFGGDQAKSTADSVINADAQPARIRAFFVHPAVARQGIGRRLLAHCEDEARRAGFRRAELMATLPGEPLYKALGYVALEPVEHRLPDGQVVAFVRMGRALS